MGGDDDDDLLVLPFAGLEIDGFLVLRCGLEGAGDLVPSFLTCAVGVVFFCFFAGGSVEGEGEARFLVLVDESWERVCTISGMKPATTEGGREI